MVSRSKHSILENWTWFVWNKGCSSAPRKTSLVTEHLSGINKFMENLKLLALYSVAGNCRIEEGPTLHSGLSDQQALSFLDVNHCHKSGTISKETIMWTFQAGSDHIIVSFEIYSAYSVYSALQTLVSIITKKQIHHDVSAGMDLLRICRFLEWIRKCLRHCLTPYFGLHLVGTNWVQYIFPCYYSVLCLPLQHHCMTSLF